MANLRKLGRRTDHRNAMLRNLVQSLITNGRITTTLTRAKDAQRVAEKLITKAKQGTLAGNRQVSHTLYSNDVARKLVEEIAPRFKERNGGYTRVLKVGPRRGDGAEMAILELVDGEVVRKKSKKVQAEEQTTVPEEKPAEEAAPVEETVDEAADAEPAETEAEVEAEVEEPSEETAE